MKAMSMIDFERLIKESNDLNIVDVRGRDAFQMGHIEGAVSIPLDELQGKVKDLDQAAEYHVVCYSGSSSAMAVEYLLHNGFKAISIQGGMNGYSGPTVS